MCTVSAAALMLGVSPAATVGLHFQTDWSEVVNGVTNGTAYEALFTGKAVTALAFGIPGNEWENLTPMPTGYNFSGVLPGPFTNHEVITTTTSTNGLNPLPNGTLSVTWSAVAANASGFTGYGPPFANPYAPNPGDEQVYYGFLRDDVNIYTTPASTQGYSVTLSGLHSVWPGGPYAIELIAATDTGNLITNAFISSVTTTQSVTYNATNLTYFNGIMGGLSTLSGPWTDDSVTIAGAPAQKGAAGAPPSGFAIASTLAGVVITDEPVVTMPPNPVPLAAPGDTVLLSACAVGVPPLSYQWRLRGRPIPGATASSCSITNLSVNTFGTYDLVVSNAYGVATSLPSLVGQQMIQAPAANVIYDSNPANPQNNGVNLGAAWLASSSDGSITRTGVMAFAASDASTGGFTVPDSAGLDGAAATITFWMKSAGTLTNGTTDLASTNLTNACILCRPAGGGNDFVIMQKDGAPNLIVNAAIVNAFTSAGAVSDGKWHFVAVAIDQTILGSMTLYLDGAPDTLSLNLLPWSWPSGQPLEFGYSTDPGLGAYNGQLSDVRYFAAVLSAAQVYSIYSTGGPADAANLQMELAFQAAPGVGLVKLNWIESTAVLQTATSLAGPWTDIPQAKPPYVIVTSGSQPRYYSYRYTPHKATNWVSNPYRM